MADDRTFCEPQQSLGEGYRSHPDRNPPPGRQGEDIRGIEGGEDADEMDELEDEDLDDEEDEEEELD